MEKSLETINGILEENIWMFCWRQLEKTELRRRKWGSGIWTEKVLDLRLSQ